MRTKAPGLDEPITEPRPEPSKKEMKKVKEGKTPKCPCGTYPKWYCDAWPRCVRI